MQGLLSLHVVAVPGTHAPAEQWSPVVQAFPSLHVLASLGVNTQFPLVASHESSVQDLLSLQVFAVPGTQEPAEQWSPVVQAFPSLQLTASEL